MSDDWKTVRVPPAQYNAAKSHKETNDHTWADVFAFYADHVEAEASELGKTEVKASAEDMRPVIREEMVDAMDEISIDVTIDAQDANMNEDDVRTIVESELESLKRELSR